MTSHPVETEPAVDAVVGVAAQPGDLLPRVCQNTFWSLSGTVLTRFLSLARGVILARLLVPDDFGLFGLASAVVGLTAMFSDFGTGTFLIYSDRNIEEHADTTFWVNLGISTILAACVALTAPLVSRFYGRPDLASVLAFLAIALWLQSSMTVHRNLVRRELRFRLLACVDSVFSLASFVAAVALAWGGYGVWAFVGSTLLGNFLSAVMLWFVTGWVPKWRVSWNSCKLLAPFSGRYFGYGVAWYLVFNLDNFMVGKFLGVGMLGIYGLAYNYALLPVTLVGGALGNVVLAELPAMRQHPAQFWHAYSQSSRLLAGVACPIAAAAVAVAPDLFAVTFGAKWNDAILPFQILAVYGAIRCMWTDPFAALGRFDIGFWLALSAIITTVLSVYVGLRFGIVGVAAAVLLVGAINLVGTLFLAAPFRSRLMEGLRQSIGYLFVAGVGAGLALGVRAACLRWLGEKRILLGLLTVVTVLGFYAGVYRGHLRRLIFAVLGATKRPAVMPSPEAP